MLAVWYIYLRYRVWLILDQTPSCKQSSIYKSGAYLVRILGIIDLEELHQAPGTTGTSIGTMGHYATSVWTTDATIPSPILVVEYANVVAMIVMSHWVNTAIDIC